MEVSSKKYIYKISENKYRVKFLRINKKKNTKIYFDEYIDGTLEEAIKLRDEQLKINGIELDVEKSNCNDIFNIDENKEKKKKEITKKKQISSGEKENIKSSATNKVDKYIYEIVSGKKYRIFIRKGGSNGQKGDYYSAVFEGTLAQAKKERDKKLVELKLKNGKGNKGNIKFIDFVRIYYKEYAEKELSPSTVYGGKNGLRNYILPEIANTPLNKIDALTVQRIISKVKNKVKERQNSEDDNQKLSETSVNNVYRLLRKILNKAVMWDYIDSNPVLKVKAPGNSKEEKESYNREELIHVLDLLKNEDAITEALFTLAICTGLRRGELVGLHVDDVNLKDNIISVKRSVIYDAINKKTIEKSTKTKKSVREVPIPLFCKEAIIEYLKLRERIIQRFIRNDKSYNPPDNLFLSSKGEIMFPDYPSKRWLSFRRKNNELKNVTLHGLRHSYCSVQMNENPDLSAADVQKLMGHSQLSTTFIYTHSNSDKKSAAISVFDKYYNANNERKINFNQILSLYFWKPFIPSKEFNELIKFIFGNSELVNDKDKKIKDYIDNKYPSFRKINIEEIDINNVWDWLEENKNKYGDEFIVSPIR